MSFDAWKASHKAIKFTINHRNMTSPKKKKVKQVTDPKEIELQTAWEKIQYDLPLRELQIDKHRHLMKLGKQYARQIRINGEIITTIHWNRNFGCKKKARLKKKRIKRTSKVIIPKQAQKKKKKNKELAQAHHLKVVRGRKRARWSCLNGWKRPQRFCRIPVDPMNTCGREFLKKEKKKKKQRIA